MGSRGSRDSRELRFSEEPNLSFESKKVTPTMENLQDTEENRKKAEEEKQAYLKRVYAEFLEVKKLGWNVAEEGEIFNI